jgi:hypothetical protein
VAQASKAAAAKRGLELKIHSQLWDFVNELVEELKDLELGDSWIRVNALHKNFYEGQVNPRIGEEGHGGREEARGKAKKAV